MPDSDIPFGEEPEIGYGEVAWLYRNAGWTSPLPVKRGTKDQGLPSGYTGNLGIDPSGADIQAWCDERPLDNLVLRMPDFIIGIDIDAYDGKNGNLTLAEAEKRWGKLPEGPKSTSRDTSRDPISGIRFFRVPAGLLFESIISFPEMGLGHIEIIQRVHRYSVCWPSLHPEGRQYNWFNSSNQFIGIPDVDELPALPQTWIDALLKKQQVKTLDFGSIEIKECLTTGDPSPRVAKRLSEAIRDLNTGNDSRHDEVNKHVLALLRFGKDGDPGVYNALIGLRELFVASITAPGQRLAGKREVAEAEFLRMITNPRAAQELAQPSKDEWVRTLIVDAAHDDSGGDSGVQPELEPEPAPEPEPEPAPPANPAFIPTPNNPTISSTYYTDFQKELETLENGFWNARESLRTIFDAAVARMAPPWGVLGIAAARAICLVPPHIVLPPIIGGTASLNQFFGLVSPSGGGKGISGAVGSELVPNFINERKLGSPEGLLEPFRDNPKDPDARMEAVWFNMAEIDGFKGLGSRNKSGGTDLLALLRECWDGASVGFGWKNDDIFIEKHTYRITLTVGIQPLRSGWLLGEQGQGGTPQRFMWFPATDERANRANWNQNFWIPQLALPSMRDFQYPKTLRVPDAVVDAIVTAQEMKNRRQMGALDGHAIQAQEKFTFTLSVIDGRSDMTDEDWELAEIAAKVSLLTREWCAAGARDAAFSEAEERGTLRGVENFAADAEKEQRFTEQLQRVTRWLLKKLREAGEAGMSQPELMKAVAGRDRQMLSKTVFEKAATEGLIRAATADGTVRWFLIP